MKIISTDVLDLVTGGFSTGGLPAADREQPAPITIGHLPTSPYVLPLPHPMPGRIPPCTPPFRVPGQPSSPWINALPTSTR